MERRLAAILAADVVGYSKLMGEDEAGTLAALGHLRRNVLPPLLTVHRGSLVKSMGDGWLVEFPSAGNAVTCAIELQNALQNHETISLRLGLHVGDVTFEDEDVYGDGVNIAARLQELAEPGGVVISEFARRSMDGKLAGEFENLGPQTLKNIAEPVSVYSWGMTAPPGIGDAPLAIPDKPSIAVLPFDNMSGDPEQEFFADGISEDIITALSRYRSFFVSARNSTFTYRGAAVDVKKVGRELGVRYVLEGSVRRGGSMLRVTAQLIEAERGNHVWAERYDRELADLFDLQDEITRSIVTTVVPEIADAEHARAIRKPIQNLDAWELYQRGIWHANRLTEKDLLAAEGLFRKSIALDSTFAAPWSGLAFVLQNQTAFGWAEGEVSRWPETLEAARQAITRDERDALAHAVIARVAAAQNNVSQALRSARQAVEHNENSSFANMTLGQALLAAKRAPEALIHIDRALRLSPRDPLRWMHEVVRGYTLFVEGRYDEAEKPLCSATLYENSGFWPHIHLANLYAHTGRIEQARAAVLDALAFQPNLTISHFIAHSALVGEDTLEHYANNLKRAGLPK